jgi:cyclopropane fatty-acyl-phospholipid synthase-like methyltransferase
VQRFDTVHSPRYDVLWGAIGGIHADFIARLAGLVREGGEVLDAACGTGKYWPALLAVGVRVTGIDQSAGMLARASRKHPDVGIRVLALQGLQDAADWHGRFDGLICVDALECVAPEHWPGVAAGLAATLRTGAPARTGHDANR